ncbi:hypothetical protein KEM52_004115 [Ascosphaera acerosa]|nr:hypothetical protein KEM52_004115 [Ascosphaera acerosa]
MDAKALLMSQGWSGPGNPLNPGRRPGAHGGLGLTKPILVARKQNTLGVGRKTTIDHTNQWWLRGFEAALKGVGTGAGTPGTATPTSEDSSYRSGLSAGSELHRYFVSGGVLLGTLETRAQGLEPARTGVSSAGSTPVSEAEDEATSEKKKHKSSKRKRDRDNEESQSRARKHRSKRSKTEKKEKHREHGDADDKAARRAAEKKEKKDLRRAEKHERRKRKEERRAKRQAKEEKRLRKEAKRARRAAEDADTAT